MTPLALAIFGQVMPEIPALIRAIANLRKKVPQLTQEQLVALVADVTGQADTAFDHVLSQIATDQKAA